MTTTAVTRPLGRRVLDTFVSPARLFDGFRHSQPGFGPLWVGPLAISVLVGIAVIIFLPDSVFFESMQGATTRRGEPVPITSDPATVALYERLRLSMGVAVAHPILAFAFAGFLMLVFSTLLRGPARFHHYLAVTTHAFLISALGAMLALPFQIANRDPALHLSVAMLTPFLDASSTIYRVLENLNIFTLWMLLVLAVGVAMVNHRRLWAPAAGLLIGLYVAMAVGLGLLTA